MRWRCYECGQWMNWSPFGMVWIHDEFTLCPNQDAYIPVGVAPFFVIL